MRWWTSGSYTSDAHIPVVRTTLETDWSILTGNVLDNAIEANLQLPESERFIRMFMDMKNTQLYLSVTSAAPPEKE